MALLIAHQSLRAFWHKLGGIRLTVILCLLLMADLVWGYFCLKDRALLFAPLNDIGLIAWGRTYGRSHPMHTLWFFILLGLLALFCLNTFICTTDRMAVLLGRNTRMGARRLFFKLAPHLMHYALVLILTGYLSSYLFARVLDSRTLVPGSSMVLPDTAAQIAFVDFDPIYYRGRGRPAFENRVLQPRAHLSLTEGGIHRNAVLSLNQPVWFKGYGIFLKDFAPQTKMGGMSRRPRIDVSIRKDPGVRLYLAGILLFTAGLAVYLAEWIFYKGREA
jgi:hypothetical protein